MAQGSASITNNGNTETIQQTTGKAILNWNSFDIAPGETTQFVQPSAGAVALNRISENKPSAIEGSLLANGNVILINPNGIVFGRTSQVNVNSLIVSASDVDDNAFMMQSRPVFNKPGSSNALILNQGQITAAQAGLVGLIAPQVQNSGIITARLGKVQLASGDTFTLDLAGDGITSVAVTGALQQQLIANSGTINADGGTIEITAAAARGVVDSLITNSGTLQANTVGQQIGSIAINNATAGGTVTNTGTISASGLNSGERGGWVTMHADNVQQQGAIHADGQAGGGQVGVTFNHSYSDTSNSTITANAVQGAGGSISISGATNAGSVLAASGAIRRPRRRDRAVLLLSPPTTSA